MQKEEEIKIIRLDVDALLYIISTDEILKLFRFSKREVEIIRMRWRERMTFPQIATKLSLTPETIKYNYHRIFRRLMCRTIRFIETYQSHLIVTADNERLKSENDGLKKSIKDMDEVRPICQTKKREGYLLEKSENTKGGFSVSPNHLRIFNSQMIW